MIIKDVEDVTIHLPSNWMKYFAWLHFALVHPHCFLQNKPNVTINEL